MKSRDWDTGCVLMVNFVISVEEWIVKKPMTDKEHDVFSYLKY